MLVIVQSQIGVEAGASGALAATSREHAMDPESLSCFVLCDFHGKCSSLSAIASVSKDIVINNDSL